MSNLRAMFLAALLLLPASRACADNRELYQADVCNNGQITVDVAIAYKDLLFNEVWMIERWWHVRPRECKPVWRQFYAPNNVLNFRSFPLHLAFAFTDSTGLWGAAMVPPPRNIAASHLQLCVSTGNQKYKVDAKDPAAACKGQREAFLIPASIDWEPTNGTTCCQGGDYGPPMKFDVALGPSDRAIPLGPRATPRVPATQAPNAPAPAAKPAPQRGKDSEPGFGDLLGPGGFVKPPSR